MAITILPRDYNPWVQALPNFLQNITLQKMAERFKGSEFEKEREEDRKARIMGLEKEGYVEYKQPTIEQLGGPYTGYGKGTISEPTPDVSYGGKQFMEPQVYAKYQQLPGGGTQPVLYRKKYGQAEETPTKFGTAIQPRSPKAPKFVKTEDGIFRWDPVTQTLIDTGKKAPKTGTQFTVGKDGHVTFSQGDVGNLTPTNTTSVQKDLIDINDRMERLSGIISRYKSSYQNVFTRMGMSYDAVKDMTGLGKPLSSEKRKSLKEYSNYKKEAVREFGLEIQRLAKGNLTKNEAKLYGRGLPNPGTGWFDGDSPAEFEGALQTSYKNLDKIRARKHYYLNKLNYSQKQIDSMLDNESILSVDAFMDRVDEIAQKREAEIVKQLQADGKPVDPQTVKNLMKKFLQDEFGFKF